jgi:hypothetical protein
MNPEISLWERVLDNAIDESLRSKPFNGCGITMESISIARKYIQGEEFGLWYRAIYNSSPRFVIDKLRQMWVSLGAHPEKSQEYRRIFNAGNGGIAKMKRIGKWRPDYEA